MWLLQAHNSSVLSSPEQFWNISTHIRPAKDYCVCWQQWCRCGWLFLVQSSDLIHWMSDFLHTHMPREYGFWGVTGNELMHKVCTFLKMRIFSHSGLKFHIFDYWFPTVSNTFLMFWISVARNQNGIHGIYSLLRFSSELVLSDQHIFFFFDQ